MAETAVEIARCGACGADVRNESLFCYNCGAAVTFAASTTVAEMPPAVSEKVLTDRKAPERPPLRSASSIRNQKRASNRQPVKVLWEPPQGSPKAFVVTTIILALGAAILLALALYLR